MPAGTELDAWEGRHVVSVVGFRFLDTRVFGMPVPFHRDFDEVNLRFYVRRRAPEGWRRGVVFVKEVVPRWAVAAVARWVYNENYVACPTWSALRLPEAGQNGYVAYGWRSAGQAHRLQVMFGGEAAYPEEGSEAAFIVEHYWGYARQRDGSSVGYQVEHPPWRVWPATEASFDGDASGFYGPPFGEALQGRPSSAFVAEGSPVVVRRGLRIRGEGR